MEVDTEAPTFTDVFCQVLPLLSNYLRLESLWKLKGVCKQIRERASSRLVWWNLIKSTRDDPPLNPFTPDVDWISVALALKLEQAQFEKALTTVPSQDLTSAGLKLRELHKLEISNTLLDKARAMIKDAAGEGSKAYGDAVYNLGLVKGQLGEITGENGTEAIRRQSVSIYEKACGPDSAEVAKAVAALGDALYVQMDKDDEAQKCYERSLAISTKLFGENSAQVAAALVGVSIVLMRQKKWEEAEKYLRKAMTIRENIFGELSGETAKVYCNLGTCLQQMGHKEDAIAFHLKSWKGREAALGPRHPYTRRAKRLWEKAGEDPEKKEDAESK